MAENTRIINVGKPTHMKLKNGSTACGLVGAQYAAYDARAVNCLSCMKTIRYAEYMGIKHRPVQAMKQSELKTLLKQSIKSLDNHIEGLQPGSLNPITQELINMAMVKREAFQEVLDAINGNAICLKLNI